MTKDGAAKSGFSLPFARLALILAALIALAAVALAMMRSSGSKPADPVASDGPRAVGDVGSMIAGLEKKLAQNPGDPKGWNLLGLSYYSVGRYADAAKAYGRATALDPNNPESWSALGEVQLLSGPGGVTPAAEASFRKALEINPEDYRARYFMAVKRDRDGDHAGAITEWIAILKDSPPGAPWEDSVRKVIADVAAANKIDLTGRLPARTAPPAGQNPAAAMAGGDSVATAGIPGPTATDLKAASSMTPSQQDDMARGMVARLAARLEADPRDADGWIRLIRARMVLNDPTAAQAALTAAKAAFKGDSVQLARFDDAAKTLGVPGR